MVTHSWSCAHIQFVLWENNHFHVLKDMTLVTMRNNYAMLGKILKNKRKCGRYSWFRKSFVA